MIIINKVIVTYNLIAVIGHSSDIITIRHHLSLNLISYHLSV